MPDTIHLPSEITVNIASKLTQALPEDLMVRLHLTKHDPFPIDVPCVGKIGSCEYDACEIITKAPAMCKGFPKGVPCKCPMPAGDYGFKDVTVKVPDMGKLLDKMMAVGLSTISCPFQHWLYFLLQGNYTGQITFYGKSDPSTLVGCFDMTFTFTSG